MSITRSFLWGGDGMEWFIWVAAIGGAAFGFAAGALWSFRMGIGEYVRMVNATALAAERAAGSLAVVANEAGQPVRRLLQLQYDAAAFVREFDNVFGVEWSYSCVVLNCRPARDVIKEGGSFIDPGKHWDQDDWFSRGALLAARERLIPNLDGLVVPVPIPQDPECKT